MKRIYHVSLTGSTLVQYPPVFIYIVDGVPCCIHPISKLSITLQSSLQGVLFWHFQHDFFYLNKVFDCLIIRLLDPWNLSLLSIVKWQPLPSLVLIWMLLLNPSSTEVCALLSFSNRGNMVCGYLTVCVWYSDEHVPVLIYHVFILFHNWALSH